MLSLVSSFGPWRRVGALVLITLVTVAYGCGPSTPTEPSTTAKDIEKSIPPEKLYKYTGTGAAKKKVPITMREKIQLLNEASKKSE